MTQLTKIHSTVLDKETEDVLMKMIEENYKTIKKVGKKAFLYFKKLYEDK